MEMVRSSSAQPVPLITVLLFAFAVIGCAPNETVLRSGKGSPTPASVDAPAPTLRTSLEQDIDAMKTADFRFIWVLRRRDGGVMDQADKNVIKANTFDVNRRVISDDGKALVIGTNAIPPKERTDAIFAYFAVEDLSPEPMPSVIPTAEKTPKPSTKPE